MFSFHHLQSLSLKSGYCQHLPFPITFLLPYFPLAPLLLLCDLAEINKVLFERGCEPAIRAVVPPSPVPPITDRLMFALDRLKNNPND